MTFLAAVLLGIVAVQPFQVGHLLGQITDVLTALAACGCVQLVAGTAQRRIPNMLDSVGLKPSVELSMMCCCPGAILKGPYSGRSFLLSGFSTTNPPLKLSRVPSFSLLIWWQTEHVTPSSAAPAALRCAANGR